MIERKPHVYSRIPKNLGKKIQKLRVARNMSQSELAERIGLSPTYIGFIEQSVRNPSVATLDKIARVLRIKLSEIFE